MTQPNLLEESDDFSLVLGGPIYQLFRRAHLAGSHLELLNRRLIIITLVAWLPLLLLAALGLPAGSVSQLSFFHDVEVHVRLLIALPVLIGAEILVAERRPDAWKRQCRRSVPGDRRRTFEDHVVMLRPCHIIRPAAAQERYQERRENMAWPTTR